ncbi:acetaldehyde dehydrogenase (acetylating) [Pseudomonas taiwanensis]|uniref:acetaldehyde dehydrogenase (acetylating) n=1 Tax=Pseudomonas TaxID=286 RepID=UPI0015BDD164|nr:MULTISPECIES: acetaldehyde dehydrogenase (acetylating) [Pseudomonas]MDH4564382.1 acetaldehyde dehydrogenase (acetylating) [Pseudomonas sp. BN411]MDH4653744.1 acetaldehyde dehydrogenase (acetylating) [Pseudomonas sp. BN606]MDH4874098.1 acetaldehyde dehydrogenase (acetylating) [Pseudomonas sp. BN515]NWL75730.1 acetaldehyde dehydrogenase (acetylating) [Pseudomonas taiwanensis]
MNEKVKCAVIGSSSIGMDLVHRLRLSPLLDPVWLIGTDPQSQYLSEAKGLGLKVTHQGVRGFLPHVVEDGVQIAFNAAQGAGHDEASRSLNALGVTTVGLASTGDGVHCIPALNLPKLIANGLQHLQLATATSQAAVPIVNAISLVQDVDYAEVVINVTPASMTCESTETLANATVGALIRVGGAKHGKVHAIVKPNLGSSAVISCIVESEPRRDDIVESVQRMIGKVRRYVPGYRLISGPYFEGNLITFGVSSSEGGNTLPVGFADEEIMVSSAVHSAEALVDRIKSIGRVSSDFDVLPT